MRQWHVDPKIMCDQHLLGEHVEHHMMVGSINRKRSLGKHLTLGQIDPSTILSRHSVIVREMQYRGMKHSSPLPEFVVPKNAKGKIDKEANRKELLRRCPKCKERAAKRYET